MRSIAASGWDGAGSVLWLRNHWCGSRMLGHAYIGIDIDSASHEIAVQRLADLGYQIAVRSAS